MAQVGAWNVPAGTQVNLSVSKDFKVIAGAIEHKNRPEAIYITISSWVKPKLSIVKAKATSTTDPNSLIVKSARDFNNEITRFERKFGSCFDPKFFDIHSVISVVEYSPGQAVVGKRQFLEIEINIDTVNTIDNKDQPCPNRATGKVEMYSFKDLEPHIIQAVKKVLSLEVFDSKKSQVSFASSKSAQ